MSIDLMELLANRAIWLVAHRSGRLAVHDDVRRERRAAGSLQMEKGDASGTRVLRDAAANRFARRVLSRAAASALRVRCASGSPEFRHASDARTEDAEHPMAPFCDMAVAAGCGRALWDEAADLLIEVPSGAPSGEYLALRVAGDSMEPALHAGDVILVRRGGELLPNTMIVARLDDSDYVVKAVQRIGRHELELASLNDAYPPFAIPRDPGSVVGTVIMRWCTHDAHA